MRGRPTARYAIAELQSVGLLVGYNAAASEADSLLAIVTEAYLVSERRSYFRNVDRAMAFAGPPNEVDLRKLVGLFDPPVFQDITLFRVDTYDLDGQRCSFERMMGTLLDGRRCTYDYRSFLDLERFLNHVLAEVNHNERLCALREIAGFEEFIIMVLTPMQAAVLLRLGLLDAGDHRIN